MVMVKMLGVVVLMMVMVALMVVFVMQGKLVVIV